MHQPRGLWSGGGEVGEPRSSRFGLRSAAHGMTRVPLHRILDVCRLLEAPGCQVQAVADAFPAGCVCAGAGAWTPAAGSDLPDALLGAVVDADPRWLSPYPTTVPDLADKFRADSERAANRSEFAVSHRWRPRLRVIDADLMRRSRVDARPQRAHT